VDEVRSDVRQRYVPGPVPNAFSALVSFSTGAVGTVHYNAVIGRRIFRSDFHGSNSTAYVDADRKSYLVEDHRDPEIRSSPDFVRADLPPGQEVQPLHWLGFWHENGHLMDCVRANRQPSSHFADATKSMELAACILRAGCGA
jgi:predicted dehydrogenase